MLPELSQETILHHSIVLPPRTGAMRHEGRIDFVSILAELDLKVSDVAEDGTQENTIAAVPKEEPTSAVEDVEGEEWLLDDLEAMTKADEAEESHSKSPEVVRSLQDKDAPSWTEAAKEGLDPPQTAAEPEFVPLQRGSDAQAEVRVDRPETSTSSLPEQRALGSSQISVPLSVDTSKSAAVSKESLVAAQSADHSNRSVAVRPASIEGGLLQAAPAASGDPSNPTARDFQTNTTPLRDPPAPERLAESQAREGHPTRKIPIAPETREGTPQESRRSPHAEPNRVDPPLFLSARREVAPTTTSQGTTPMQSTPAAIAPGPLAKAESRLTLRDGGSEFFVEEAAPIADRSAVTGRDMFQSVRGAVLGPHAEHPQALSVVRQVSEAIRLTPGNGIDIALRPEELGSVRLSLSGQEGQMSVVVQAERPETLDLMRRHIDSLSQEFRAIGYGDVSFSFQSGGDSARDEQDGEPGTVAVIEEMPSDDTRREASGSIAKRSGLDMRI